MKNPWVYEYKMHWQQKIHYSVYELLTTAPEFLEYFLNVMSGQVFIGEIHD